MYFSSARPIYNVPRCHIITSFGKSHMTSCAGFADLWFPRQRLRRICQYNFNGNNTIFMQTTKKVIAYIANCYLNYFDIDIKLLFFLTNEFYLFGVYTNMGITVFNLVYENQTHTNHTNGMGYGQKSLSQNDVFHEAVLMRDMYFIICIDKTPYERWHQTGRW